MRRVQDVMTDEVVSCRPNETIFQAALKMKEHGVGAMPVCEGDKLMGMVTDRDLVLHGIADKRPGTETLDQIMNEELCTVDIDASMKEAEMLMTDYKVRRLPVEQEGRIQGMITIGDIAVDQESDENIGCAIREISRSAS